MQQTSLVLVAVLLLVGLTTPAAAVALEEDATEHLTLTSSSEYATIEEGDLELDFEKLNARAVTNADEVFEITVTDDEVDAVWIEHDVDGVTFYADGDRDTPVDASSPLELDTGEIASIGVSVDTHVATTSSETFDVHVTMAAVDEDDEDEDETASDVRLTDVDVSPTELEVGETLTASATYENEGNATGLTIARLTVDGIVVDRETTMVRPGERETITFERVMESAGTFAVGISGRETTVTVTEPDGPSPAFVLTETTLEPESIAPGESVRATGTVENQGDAPGSKTVELAVGGVVVDTETVELEPGEAKTVAFEWRFDEPGTYAVAIDGVPAGSGEVIVGDRASIVVGSRELGSPTTAAVAFPLSAGTLFLLTAARRRRDLWTPWWVSRRD